LDTAVDIPQGLHDIQRGSNRGESFDNRDHAGFPVS
jgi:hypothetical protein